MKSNTFDIEAKLIDEGLLNTKQAGAYVCLSERTLQGMRRTGDGPQFIKISSRCVRYRISDLKNWIVQNIRTSTSDSRP